MISILVINKKYVCLIVMLNKLNMFKLSLIAMTRGKTHQNNGPCAVCGLQNSEETFRKLTKNILAKAIKSPAAQQLTFNLYLNDQLCQLY
ncbi:unnamed protein product [Rhizophagus irregularis]|nr:unnamed protein product [Rhizophagus irregularis]